MTCNETARREYRRQLLARLAETQAALLTALLGLMAAQLAAPSLPTGRSPLDILVEQANADTEAAAILQAFLGDAATDARESALNIAGEVPAAVAHFLTARRLLLDTLARVSDDDLYRAGHGFTPAGIMERRYVDSARRAADFGRSLPRPMAPSFGPPSVLFAALRAARKDLLTTIARIPDDERPGYRLRGGSNLLSHLVGLASHDRELLRHNDFAAVAGSSISRPTEWHTAWRDLHATRHRLLTLLAALSDEDLRAPAGRYVDICRLVDTDRALAARLRESLRSTHHFGPVSFSP